MIPYLKIIALIALVALVYHEVLVKLVFDWWKDPNYSHGFVVPLVSLYLLWRKRAQLVRLNRIKSPSFPGLVLMGAGLAMLVAGRAGAELFLQRFSLLVVMAGMVLLFCGRGMLKSVSPALAFLMFMIPIPYMLYDSISFPLKLFTSCCAAMSLTLLHIPVLREGNLVHLANTTLEVADACSGIRSLISLLAIGSVIAWVTLRSNWKRALVILLVIPIAVFANAARVVITGVLAHFYGSAVAEGFFHEYAGLMIYLVSLFLLLSLCGIIRRDVSEPGREQAGTPYRGKAGAV